MRLIDADKVKQYVLTEGFYCDTEVDREYTAERIDQLFPTVEAIPKVLYEQIRWERDVALSQLKQLNIELFEKPYLKAIPIVWIKKRIENWADYSAQYLTIVEMLEDWRKENER